MAPSRVFVSGVVACRRLVSTQLSQSVSPKPVAQNGSIRYWPSICRPCSVNRSPSIDVWPPNFGRVSKDIVFDKGLVFFSVSGCVWGSVW